MPTEYPNKILKLAELRIGDIVKMFDGPWGTAIVKNVTPEMVTIFRPYGAHTEFAISNGVICYTGTEMYDILLPSTHEYLVYQRNEVK